MKLVTVDVHGSGEQSPSAIQDLTIRRQSLLNTQQDLACLVGKALLLCLLRCAQGNP
jgi:hypothetical protein